MTGEYMFTDVVSKYDTKICVTAEDGGEAATDSPSPAAAADWPPRAPCCSTGVGACVPVAAATVCAFLGGLHFLQWRFLRSRCHCIIVFEGLVLQARLAFHSRHVAKVANELLHKVHEKPRTLGNMQQH